MLERTIANTGCLSRDVHCCSRRLLRSSCGLLE
jgi:hypothetical protein